jgi:hypothetical protein
MVPMVSVSLRQSANGPISGLWIIQSLCPACHGHLCCVAVVERSWISARPCRLQSRISQLAFRFHGRDQSPVARCFDGPVSTSVRRARGDACYPTIVPACSPGPFHRTGRAFSSTGLGCPFTRRSAFLSLTLTLNPKAKSRKVSSQVETTPPHTWKNKSTNTEAREKGKLQIQHTKQASTASVQSPSHLRFRAGGRL